MAEAKKLTIKDLEDELKKAEEAIAKFEPPSAVPPPPSEPDKPPPPPDFAKIQEEVAVFSAAERGKAMFKFMENFARQIANEELDKRMPAVNKQLSDIQAELDAIKQRLSNGGL